MSDAVVVRRDKNKKGLKSRQTMYPDGGGGNRKERMEKGKI